MSRLYFNVTVSNSKILHIEPWMKTGRRLTLFCSGAQCFPQMLTFLLASQSLATPLPASSVPWTRTSSSRTAASAWTSRRYACRNLPTLYPTGKCLATCSFTATGMYFWINVVPLSKTFTHQNSNSCPLSNNNYYGKFIYFYRNYFKYINTFKPKSKHVFSM